MVTIRTSAVPVDAGRFAPTEVDIYTPVETTIKAAVSTQTEVAFESTEYESG